MMLFAAIIFFLSLFGIIGLLALKRWEELHGRVLAPHVRHAADLRALHVKDLLIAGRHDLAKVPPFLLHASQRTLHGIAVDFSHLAYATGRLAHKLADSVSHKRHFTRRETRSEFLKKVSEGIVEHGEDDASRV